MMLPSDDTHDTEAPLQDDASSCCSSSSDHKKDKETLLALRIKSYKDVEIHIGDASSVAQVKQAVRNALGEEAQDRYLRLICKGRLLAPDSSSLNEFSVQNGDVLHAVLAAAGVRGGQQAALARGISRRVPRNGTGVGAGGRVVRATDDESSDEDGDDEEAARERLGFDRLRGTGLSRTEIAAIRSYFSRQVDRFLLAHPELASEAASGETDPRRRRLLHEDAWMQAQGPTSEFRFNLQQNNPFLSGTTTTASNGTPLFRATSVGTDRDFMWGFLLGFFVGFLMLVWVWMPTVPHKQKLGILTGISFQLAMNFLKSTEDHDADFVDGD